MKKRCDSHQFYRSAAAFAILAVCVSLAACGSARTAFSKEAVMETAAAAPEAVFDEGGNAVMEMPQETAAGAVPYSEMPEFSAPAVSKRKLIRNVNLTVETTEFDALLSAVSRSVTDLGGYLESSDVSGSGLYSSYEQQRHASLTVRIPSDKLDGFIAQVDTKGNVTSHSENTQDVTLQYSDVESRKKSLTIEQERLWALLEKADSVDAVIALESRLSEIRYQLESLESQLRTYDNQVDYSTAYLSIHEVKVFTPTSPDSVSARMRKGFQKSLNDVGNGFLNLAVWFVSNLPLLVVLAVIAAILLLTAKRFLSGNSRKKTLRLQSSAAQTAPPQKSQTPSEESDNALMPEEKSGPDSEKS